MAKVVNAAIAGVDKGEEFHHVSITRTVKKGIINKRIEAKSIQVKMTEERFEKEMNAIEKGRIQHFTNFEHGETYR